MRRVWRKLKQNRDGSVSIEAAFMVPLIALLIGGAIECSYAFYQWNAALQSARHGARIAATSDPVAADLRTMTGVGNGVEAGDPMPDYQRTCSGKSQSCTQTAYSSQAMNRIFYGPDLDMQCKAAKRERRGMCDLFKELELKNVQIEYNGSGLGRAGFPADPAPMITVTVRDMEFDFVFLDLIAPQGLKKIPPVQASQMSEDLRNG